MLAVESSLFDFFWVLRFFLYERRFKVAVRTNPEFLSTSVDYLDFLVA